VCGRPKPPTSRKPVRIEWGWLHNWRFCRAFLLVGASADRARQRRWTNSKPVICRAFLIFLTAWPEETGHQARETTNVLEIETFDSAKA
jgi:hypothetical protein